MLMANLWTVAQPAIADGHSAAAEAHIEAMIGSAKNLLATDFGDNTIRTKQVSRTARHLFRLSGITRFSAGQYWRAATSAEKQEYELVIREVIIGTVLRNFDQLKGLEYRHVKAPKRAASWSSSRAASATPLETAPRF